LKRIELEEGNKARMIVLAEITRLRQACCHPQLVDKSLELASSKMALIQESISELIDNNHRALVFSQFTSHLALLRQWLDEQGIAYEYLDGSTPAKKRQESVNSFQAGNTPLFLISLKAGGTGLNLTAADYVLHLDPWWNPAVEDQASDRAHRMGQKRPVTVYRFITTNTIEEKILALHGNKRQLADALLSGSEKSASLSADQLLDLLKED
ncbi:MAG: SWF/SNF helicase family protein, partial [Lentisphaeraceae bacterium]|nr:SWF/SNF helicase family protein [Lentisphaeraceae bacterium]